MYKGCFRMNVPNTFFSYTIKKLTSWVKWILWRNSLGLTLKMYLISTFKMLKIFFLNHHLSIKLPFIGNFLLVNGIWLKTVPIVMHAVVLGFFQFLTRYIFLTALKNYNNISTYEAKRHGPAPRCRPFLSFSNKVALRAGHHPV